MTGEVIKRNKRAKRMEARYAADLVLPAPQLRGAEGELALHEQVYPMPRSPCDWGPRHRQDLIALSDISALRERTRLLRQAERRLRALTNTVPGVVLQFTLLGSHHPGGVCEPGQSRAAGAGEPADPGQSQRDPDPHLPSGQARDASPHAGHAASRTTFLPICCAISTPPRGTRWLQFSGRGAVRRGWRIYGWCRM